MEPSEIEFVAEKERVFIIPNFSADRIYLIEVHVRIYVLNHLSLSYFVQISSN